MTETAPPVALVTGAARGIGRQIALSLVRAGYTLGIHDRDEEPLALLAGEIRALGGTAHALVADVDDPAACTRLVDELLARFGRINALVSNAGQASSGQSLRRTPVEEVSALLQTHVLGAFCVVQAVLPGMRARGEGSIVAISSAAAQLLPTKAGAYSMAKCALEAFVLTLAKEEGSRGIRANIVAPSIVDAGMGLLVLERIRLSSVQAGEEQLLATLPTSAVADAVEFLLSDRASHVSGQRLVVDHLPPPASGPA